MINPDSEHQKIGPSTAFKEWAVICRALITGRQDIILRKGGIVEPGGSFQLLATEFYLFPTFVHQSEDHLIPSAQDLVANIDEDRPPPGTVEFRHKIHVTESFTICEPDKLAALRPRHVWSDAIVNERFHRWEQNLHVMVVTVHPVTPTICIPWEKSYRGCKSWITFDPNKPGK
ncbi:MAG TPA: hypothetical protein DEB70_09580 [Planctomycetaceae bacterium]|nr:hypothetical protein [Planctomycetaceae bacterium]